MGENLFLMYDDDDPLVKYLFVDGTWYCAKDNTWIKSDRQKELAEMHERQLKDKWDSVCDDMS